jgi:hypothetical protein
LLAFPQLIKKQEESITHLPEKKIVSVFKTKMLSSLSKITKEKKKEMTESDRKVAKTVEKYLNQGEGLTRKDFEKLD